jgi:hypothetical protein
MRKFFIQSVILIEVLSAGFADVKDTITIYSRIPEEE